MRTGDLTSETAIAAATATATAMAADENSGKSKPFFPRANQKKKKGEPKVCAFSSYYVFGEFFVLKCFGIVFCIKCYVEGTAKLLCGYFESATKGL
jgi:hypothetical protein